MELWKAALQAGSCKIEAAGHGQVLPAVQDQAAAGGVRCWVINMELMPCPCCGNNAKPRQFRSGILKSRTVHYVECVVCRLRTPVELDIETAAETWNRRAKTCYSAPKLMPMGALTYAIACSHCKNRESSLCEDCVCEVTSGFELDPDTLPAAPGIWLAGKDDLGIDRG